MLTKKNNKERSLFNAMHLDDNEEGTWRKKIQYIVIFVATTQYINRKCKYQHIV